MSKFPKTVAAVQKRDHSQWEIGDALIAECGKPPLDKVNDGSYAKLEAAAREIEHLKIDGYPVGYLAILREIASKFPAPIRNRSISWAAHRSSGSPEMLTAIVKAAGSKPVTNTFVRTTRIAIQEHQARKHQEQGARKTLPPVKDIPSEREVKSLALIAEVAQRVNDLKRCDVVIEDVSEWLGKHLSRLETVDIDYLVEIALGLSNKSRELADIARKLRSNRRSHLSVVGED